VVLPGKHRVRGAPLREWQNVADPALPRIWLVAKARVNIREK
jgi:hypothetical protein